MRSRILLTALTLCCIPGTTRAQAGSRLLQPEPVIWSQWEVQPTADKATLLSALGFCSPSGGSPFSNYHLLDIDGDGQLDVLYSGPNFDCREYGEGGRSEAYLSRGDSLVHVFSSRAEVISLWRAAPWQAVSLVVREDGCCGDIYSTLTYLRPSWHGDSLSFEPYDAVRSVFPLVWPPRLWSRPRPFRVQQERYMLRAEPLIDDTSQARITGYDEDRGNVVAEYPAGAKGMALAERRDATGRSWYFVLMDLGSRPLRAIQLSPDQVRTLPPLRYVGWMSARYLSLDSSGVARVRAGPPSN